MRLELRSPFIGVPLNCTTFEAKNNRYTGYLRGATRKPFRRGLSCKCNKKVDFVFYGNKIKHFSGRNAELLWKKLELQSGRVINSVSEPIVRNERLVKFVTPSKAKLYVETNLLPSVCTLLSDHLQRELDFGKVRRISPLGITLESCSIGPHSEEFSCGEVPPVKLRIRPFASLRRGKIVVDAVLSSPSLLVAQKKNYTWLGIPYLEGVPQRHLSTEEGIDHRTRTRRLAREEATARWERERDDAAKVSAENGYIISECEPEDDTYKEHTAGPTRTRLGTPDPFHYTDKKLQWRDHHCMDAGAEYDLKHADLERSFGAKVSSLENSIWSRIMPGSVRHKFKRKASGRDLSMSNIASKRRLLECSASAARSFFEGSVCFDSRKMDSSMRSSEHAGASCSEGTQFKGDQRALYQDVKVDNSVCGRDDELAVDLLTNNDVFEADNKLKTDFVSRVILEIPSRNRMDKAQGPFLFTSVKLSKVKNYSDKFSSVKTVRGTRNTNNSDINNAYLEGDNTVKIDVRLVKEVDNVEDDISGTQSSGASSSSSRIEKMIPVVLDSVHFQGGTLMLLAYGDTEPKMEVASGHVKFQNHYGRVHVQLSGNCKMWRSDLISEDGGWLSTDVYVDIIEQKWHANLKVANLFVPLFERILELPISWFTYACHGEKAFLIFMDNLMYTVEQPLLDGSAYFHRATVSSPVLQKPVTNFGGTILVNSNRLRIHSLEGKVSRKGKLSLKGNLPLRTSEAFIGDKLDLKCEVDSQLQISGSIMQPNMSGKIKISQGEVYLPHDKGSGTAPFINDTTNEPRPPACAYCRMVATKYVSRFLNLKPASINSPFRLSPGAHDEADKEMVQVNGKPKLDIRLSDLRIVLGAELRIVYPLILNFAISRELELNGPAHPKSIKPKGVLTFENGDVNLVATQHLNVAKFEPDNGLDPTLDLALVGSEWQFRIQSRASKWQEKLVVTSTRSVEQDLLSTTEAARVFEGQLAESILEGDGQLAFKKLATATLETLMPRIEPWNV
ncbi:hypothetical protein SASPL_102833 [Salvia splendens]|uniref:Translocation and assembly module TamB C-terminal domain-containing protein n=1 Tax=Salvia splendens TaxID=180675 RepID=A0A8X8YWN6_SALSN|nr:hypothetical protein SASPL_102833 [Salvia splendens]